MRRANAAMYKDKKRRVEPHERPTPEKAVEPTPPRRHHRK